MYAPAKPAPMFSIWLMTLKNIFAVEDFVQNFYSEEEIFLFLEPPKPKLTQIYDIMTQVKKSTPKK